jgi:hypothetical protein
MLREIGLAERHAPARAEAGRRLLRQAVRDVQSAGYEDARRATSSSLDQQTTQADKPGHPSQNSAPGAASEDPSECLLYSLHKRLFKDFLCFFHLAALILL